MKMQIQNHQAQSYRTPALRVSVLDRLKAQDAEGYAMVFALWELAERAEQRRMVEKAWARRERRQNGRSVRPVERTMKTTLPGQGVEGDYGVRVAISARPIPNPTTRPVYQS